MGVGGQRHAQAALPPGKRAGTHCIGGWVGPSGGLDRSGKSRPTGIRSPDRPVRSQSLYRLSYLSPPRKVAMNANRLQAKRNLTKGSHRKAG
jgi:hypothetical protein